MADASFLLRAWQMQVRLLVTCVRELDHDSDRDRCTVSHDFKRALLPRVPLGAIETSHYAQAVDHRSDCRPTRSRNYRVESSRGPGIRPFCRLTVSAQAARVINHHMEDVDRTQVPSSRARSAGLLAARLEKSLLGPR